MPVSQLVVPQLGLYMYPVGLDVLGHQGCLVLMAELLEFQMFDEYSVSVGELAVKQFRFVEHIRLRVDLGLIRLNVKNDLWRKKFTEAIAVNKSSFTGASYCNIAKRVVETVNVLQGPPFMVDVLVWVLVEPSAKFRTKLKEIFYLPTFII